MWSILLKQDSPFQSTLDFVPQSENVLSCLFKWMSYVFVVGMQTNFNRIIIGGHNAGWFPVLDLDHQDAKSGTNYN
jgi:hypothetical protein